MKRSADESYEFRAGIGVGASLGVALGAVIAVLFFRTSQAVIIGSIIGGALGAVVGSRVKSQSFQYLWIELSSTDARRLVIACLLFLAPFSLFIYVLKVGTTPGIEILLISAASAGSIYLVYTFGYVISQLDDLLRSVILEAIAIGFGLSLGFFLILGLVSLAYPIQSNWLIVFIFMLMFTLMGRIIVAVKYR